MITQNELSSLNLSPTKKDFVQIWNELIEVASKITERWDPTSTNESDPGIVLLKVLTGIADKLNYNIDKNILEAYMPTAAQMESMRKLCELVGYDIKYYQSAETKVRISYTGNTTDRTEANDEKLPSRGLALPKFTTITNADKDITFVTTNAIPVLLTNDTPWVEVPCIEGQISQCESINENNLITLSQLDANNRYYLPEIQIAENGIFVYNAATSIVNNTPTLVDGTSWTRVTNLNTQSAETRVFKFGYDSFEGRPYLAFPTDIGSLIGDGLFIYFVRTSGLSGNISPRALEVLEIPSDSSWGDYSAEQFEVVNIDATTNGANIENISSAYNNFKKTVGTFDTLVTCRDYMNKIYSLLDASNSPYVSNILVTDIRNDINKAITLCSCNEFGILYKETPITKSAPSSSSVRVDEVPGEPDVFKCIVNSSNAVTEVPLIDHFDLLLYPFKTFTQVSSGTKDLATPYNKSFTYTEDINREIEVSLADLKTCAHNLTSPIDGDIVAINNYLRLNALIATSTRVSEIEAEGILKNIKVALVNEFNLRNLDFGEAIPFDSILSIIENADSRIKVVSLQEPTLLTTYSVKDQASDGATSKEYGIASSSEDEIVGVYYKDKDGNDYQTKKGETAKDIYNKLVLRNILAGRASLFDYDETFIPNNSEKPYTATKSIDDIQNAIQVQISADPTLSAEDKVALEHALLDKREQIDEIAEAVVEAHTDAESGKISAGDYILYDENDKPVKGLYGGITTLQVSEKAEQKLYETYEPFKITNELKDIIKDGIIDFKGNDKTRNIAKKEAFKDGIISDIKRVEAVCEIKSAENTFKNITLSKNEVIKFRAPNLITTKTFPAYVYYHFEHKDTVDSPGATTASDYGSFAKAMTLSKFINQDNIGGKKFFEKLWEKAGIDFTNETYTFDVESADPSNPKIPSGVKLATIFNNAIAVEAETPLQVKKKDATTKLPLEPVQYVTYPNEYNDNDNDPVKIFVKESELIRVLNEHFSNSANTTPIKFRYYPLTYNTSNIWSTCIKEFDPSLPTDDVLWKLSSTSNHPRGKLVTESGKKLYAMDGDTLNTGVVSEVTYICTYLGSDPNYSSIGEKSDIELRSNDKLYIHYTPSSTNEDGKTVNAEPISIVYEGGDSNNPIIIKPSGFTLMPSVDVNRQGTSYKKYVTFPGESTEKGLLALAPNEQIELRSISKVVLSSDARFYKNFDNAELEHGNINATINYELKDGEYIFYTDRNTQEAAYYGSGSVITLDKGAFIPKAKEIVEVSQILEQGLHIVPWSDYVSLNNERKITITEYQYITLVNGDTLNTLTVDDTDDANLKVWREDETDGYVIGGTNWIKCLSTNDDPIIYTPAGSETSITLPRIDLNSGPSTSWEVCSFLELSTSPGYSQQLRTAAIQSKTDSGEIKIAHINNKINLYSDAKPNAKPMLTIAPITEQDPVSFKLSTIAQAASGTFEKTDSDLEDDIDDAIMQMKLFKEDASKFIELTTNDADITPISDNVNSPAETVTEKLNNYWTKLEVSSMLSRTNPEYNYANPGGPSEEIPKTLPNALNLNFMIPEESDVFGIFSIYLNMPENMLDEVSKYNIPRVNSRVFIDIPKEFGTFQTSQAADQAIISIFNCKTISTREDCRWWPEGIDSKKSNRLYLRAGLNCIRVNKSCNLLIKAESEATGSLLYDNMRLVRGRKTHGINLALLNPDASFNSSSEKTETERVELAEAILNGLADLDKKQEFYYNVPIENSLAIEFDKNINSFSNPYTLYDLNNINNDFVISKLDVKYLDEGLKIAKSSKY